MVDFDFPGFAPAFRSVINLAEARRVSSQNLELRYAMLVQGQVTPGDLLAGSGLFSWVPDSMLADDGQTVICPGDVLADEPGRWVVLSVNGVGPIGPPGPAATIAVGSVASGSSAAITNVGTTSAAVLNFTLPIGPPGPAATVHLGSVTTGASGSTATVTNTGTTSNAVLNFTFPQPVVSSANTIAGLGYTPANRAGDTFSGTVNVTGGGTIRATATNNNFLSLNTSTSYSWINATAAAGGYTPLYIYASTISLQGAVQTSNNVGVTGSVTSAGIFTSAGITVTGGTVTLYANPTTAMQAATKQYVDSAIAAAIAAAA